MSDTPVHQMCDRWELCEDTFDSMEQVLPILAEAIDIKGMTPAMAAHAVVRELLMLRKSK